MNPSYISQVVHRDFEQPKVHESLISSMGFVRMMFPFNFALVSREETEQSELRVAVNGGTYQECGSTRFRVEDDPIWVM